MSLRAFFIELTGKGKRVEGELFSAMLYSLLTSFIFLGAVYVLKLKGIDNFMPRYGFFLFFSALSYALILPSLRHIRAYRELPCMSGMMTGMTTGMIAGFLPGFYIASTNGMFIGGFFGVFFGIAIGIWNGKCCGIMGLLEGVMAGFMGGLMGAMTAFMLLNDHLKIAGVIVFLISSLIVSGLHYMLYLETREHERQNKEDYFFTITLTFILIAITTWLIVFGPRNALFAG